MSAFVATLRDRRSLLECGVDHSGTSIGSAEEVQRCIRLASTCHRACVETISECLALGGRHAAPGHVRLLLDCAELCQTVANFLLRGSTLAPAVCLAVSQACARGATECTRLGLDACAEACDRCAESCVRLAGATADAKISYEKPDNRSYLKWSSGGERGQGRDSGTGPPLPG